MKIAKLTPFLSVAPQIGEGDIGVLASRGFKAIVNNRPDGEGEGQPTAAALKDAAERHGLQYRDVPVVSGQVTDADVAAFERAMAELKGPVLAFCRTGTRSSTLWALSEAPHLAPDAILEAAGNAGYDLSGLRPRLERRAEAAETGAPEKGAAFPGGRAAQQHEVVIVGGGAGGLATAASLLARRPGLDIAVIEPSETHYYQPGWTLVGGGVFDRAKTEKPMHAVMPEGVRWIHAAVAGFEPERNQVVLEDGGRVGYRTLVAAPGLELHWAGIEGLQETLGKNGVTSNYLFEMAPYTWELVQATREGKALFTQPPMPIKCAGAPQKAAYLACSHWEHEGWLDGLDVEFHTAGGVLFGVKDFVPALMTYVERYGIDVHYSSNLVAVDGPKKTAWFDVTQDGKTERVQRSFDMLHVCPPQRAPRFVRESPLAAENGWVEVSPETLQHTRYGNVFGVGDAMSAPNAKTAAAVRKQAPTVAQNVLAVLDGEAPRALYDGYGSCPLTVERGKIVLAEFGYGGKLLPTFPFLNARKPSRAAWFLKEKLLPWMYFDLMLRGREWLAKPKLLPHAPAPHEAPEAFDFKGAPPAGAATETKRDEKPAAKVS
jgi:sulfide:quinone oxidoreductase